jgi:general secretion pathway protein F
MAASEGQIRETLSALEQSLRAGLPLTRAEWTMGLPTKLAAPLKASVNAGKPLAEALHQVLGLFPYEQLLLQAGEGSGNLPDAIAGVLDGRARRIKLRRRVMVALAYPVLVLLAAIVFLPLPLLFTDKADVYLSVVGSGLLMIGTPLFISFVVWPRVPPSAFRMLPWSIARSTPFIGRRLAWRPTSLLCDVLGQSIAAGVPVRSALGAALEATGDPLFADAAHDAGRAIDQGGTLAEAMQQIDDLPGQVLRQVAVAEQAGRLEDVLRALAADASEQYRRTLWAMIVATGVLVFGIAALVAVVGIVGAAQTFYFDKMDALIEEAEQ